MYYNNSDATDQSNPAGVWNEYYRGVWHLKEEPDGTTDEIKDSTSGGNHLTSNGGMSSVDQVAGVIDGCLDFDGSTDYLDRAAAKATDFQ